MNDSWNVTRSCQHGLPDNVYTRFHVPKDGQQDVDEEVCAATTLKEDTERREENGDDDLDDVSAADVLACAFMVPAAASGCETIRLTIQ